jgi:hypothetical protein
MCIWVAYWLCKLVAHPIDLLRSTLDSNPDIPPNQQGGGQHTLGHQRKKRISVAKDAKNYIFLHSLGNISLVITSTKSVS